MKILNVYKVLLSFLFLSISLGTYAGIDYSRYDDAPIFFLGWENSFFFAIGAIVLYGLSLLLSEWDKDNNGNVKDGLGCIIVMVNVAMLICAICSYYLLIPLFIIYALLKAKKK